MRKPRPKNSAAKFSVARTSEADQKSASSVREVVNLEAIFGKPNFGPKDLMEKVVEPSNMIKAMVQVQRNKGAPGVDGMKTEDLPKYFEKQWEKVKANLLVGKYKPSLVRRVEIPKPDGGVRELGIPTCADRVIQQAIGHVLGEIFDPTFSESSYGFRPKRSAQMAVAKAHAYVTDGRIFVVDLDLEKFFDRVNHDILMDRISRRIKDKRILKTIRAYLEAGVMIGGFAEPRREGAPQGGPLSPLLSNILLDELDQELERRGHKFCRYADDWNVYVRSRKAGERVKAALTRWLKIRLKLTVNEGKSAVDYTSRRKFLGYSMTSSRAPKLKPATQAIERFKGAIRELFRRARGRNVKTFITNDLNPLLRGWAEYFKLSQVKLVFEQLDGWIRRKLRCVIWRQWKTPKTRLRKLIAHRLKPEHAKKSASNGRGPWWNSGNVHMVIAFPNKHFDRLGLITLQKKIRRTAIAD